MRAINDELGRILKDSAEKYKSSNRSKMLGFFHGKSGLNRAANIINGVNEGLDPVVLLATLLNSTSSGLKDIVLNKLLDGRYDGLMSEQGLLGVLSGSCLSSVLFDEAYLEEMKSDFNRFYDDSVGEYPTAQWNVTFNKEKAVRHFIELYRNSLTNQKREDFDAQVKSAFLERKPALNAEEGSVMRIG